MKKHLTLILTVFLFSLSGSAQEFPTYGKPTREELSLKECAFDKQAPAIVLVDEALSTYNDQRNLITYRHIRIKILRENGINFANVSIPFYRKDDFEYIRNVEGLVINSDLNGNPVTQALDKKAIFTKNLSERIGEIRFTFPSVKPGTIIEYKFESTMQHYGGLEDWYFQKEIPVARSKYVLYIVPGYEFTYQVFKNPNFNIDIQLQEKEGRVQFEMQNIAGLEDEPYMDARKDYIQRVAFQLSGYGTGNFDKKKYMTSWDEVTKELLNSPELGLQINKDLPGVGEFIKTVKSQSSQFEKMRLVLDYVRENMSWTGYNSRYSVDGIKAAWNKKKGNSAEMNLILLNLLKTAGVEAYPILVSERYHGKVNTQYPFVDQFNTIYAAVFIDGKKYYLDATDPFTPPHIIPYNILNTTGLILNKKAGGLVVISDEARYYRDAISVVANVTTDDNVKGEVFMNSMDYAKIRRLERYRSNNNKYIEDNFKQRSSMTIDSFKIINQDKDSLDLQHQFAFVLPLEGTGDYKFVPLNLFSGFETNPFISDKRFSDINFGFKRSVTVNYFVTLPDDYLVDAMPKSIMLTNVDKSILFTRELYKDPNANKVVSRMKMDFKKSHYTVDEYDDIKEFYKKMFDMLAEQIVLKKKS